MSNEGLQARIELLEIQLKQAVEELAQEKAYFACERARITDRYMEERRTAEGIDRILDDAGYIQSGFLIDPDFRGLQARIKELIEDKNNR